MQNLLITTSFAPDAVIIGNGDFPTAEIPLAAISNARYVCCCDGAAASYISCGFVPDAIVGDGDSLDEVFKEKYRDILHIIDEQDDNDQTKATRHCLSMGFRSIAYVGATGKREDHTLGNISLIERYRNEMGIDAVMLTDHGYFVAAEGDAEFETFAGQQVSIFNFSLQQDRKQRTEMELLRLRQLVAGHSQRGHRQQRKVLCRWPLSGVPHLQGKDLA